MNMKVDLCGVTLNNPVMTASGTFGSGAEYAEFVDLNKLGAVVTKGVFDENDGYVDTPKAVAIKLSNGDEFCVKAVRPSVSSCQLIPFRPA